MIIDRLPASSSPEVPDEIRRKEQRRKRYIESLGDQKSIDVQRVEPENSPLWHEIGVLRREVYVDEHGYLPSEVVDENGREYDVYDEKENTVHICATDSTGEVIGYVRMLTKGRDGKDMLPAEHAFGVELEGDVVEVSRLISKKGFPGSPMVTLSLIRAVMHEMNANPDKYGTSVATLEPFLAQYIGMMGIPIKVLAELQETPEYNSQNMLVEMDPSKIVEEATKMDKHRNFSPVFPEQLGPWFDSMKTERGLGRVALTNDRSK